MRRTPTSTRHGDVRMSVTRHPARVVEHRHDRDRAADDDQAARRRAALVRPRPARRRSTSRARPAGCCSRRTSTTTPVWPRPRSGTASRSPACRCSTRTSTIANGGVTRPPHLLDATIDASGERHAVEMHAGRRVVSAKTAHEMTEMLTGVVSHGTGACAAIPGYTVAGKTGTAQQGAQRADTPAATMASFIGYAPANNPRFASIVVLDEPATQYGGTAAAPVFADDRCSSRCTRSGVAPDDADELAVQRRRRLRRPRPGPSVSIRPRPRAKPKPSRRRRPRPPRPPRRRPPPRRRRRPTARARRRSIVRPRAVRPRTGGRGAASPPDSLPADTSQSG